MGAQEAAAGNQDQTHVDAGPGTLRGRAEAMLAELLDDPTAYVRETRATINGR